jgi:DNA-directed RNA polymerase specialized sigma24 family protein
MKLEEGTVKSKLHRARTAFMKRMKKAQSGGPGSGEEG